MKYLFAALMLLLSGLMVVFNDSAMLAAADGLRLFGQSIFPSLFPFLVGSRFIVSTGILRPRGGRMFSLITSWFVSCVCGTPTGAVCAEDLYEQGSVSASGASILCGLWNNAGPMFVYGSLASAMLGNISLGHLLAISHYLPSLMLTLLVSAFVSAPPSSVQPIQNSAPSSLTGAISDATLAILRIGGTIVFFRVLCAVISRIGIFSALPPSAEYALYGLLEFTNGISLIADADIPPRICCALCTGIMSFGGLCIFTQSTQTLKLLPLPYFSAKLLHGLLSFGLCYVLFPVFGHDTTVFGEITGLTGGEISERALPLMGLAACTALSLAAILMYAAFVSRRTGRRI